MPEHTVTGALRVLLMSAAVGRCLALFQRGNGYEQHEHNSADACHKSSNVERVVRVCGAGDTHDEDARSVSPAPITGSGPRRTMAPAAFSAGGLGVDGKGPAGRGASDMASQV
ncbi:MAG: hypothetical protein IPK82_37260 [Polyangiaceae bacterium]|nr:hypothetical protein [Polyangiaceae bacterium]